jgi:hypothetical protein
MARSTSEQQPAESVESGAPAEKPAAAAPSEAERAAAKRAAAAGGVTDEDRRRLDALIAERRGYVQRGLDDRVSGVDAQLERLGRTEKS